MPIGCMIQWFIAYQQVTSYGLNSNKNGTVAKNEQIEQERWYEYEKQ